MTDTRNIPTQAETGLATFTLLVDSQEVGGALGLDTICVVKKVNKIPAARIIIFDGSVAHEDFELSSGKMFLPGKEVVIKGGYRSDEAILFKGIIVKHSIEAKKDKPSRLIIDLKDEAVKMTIGRRSKYFEKISDGEMFEEIIGKYGLTCNVEATDVIHAEMVQHHVSDWDFIVSRSEVNGKLVLVDNSEVTVKAPDFAQKPFVKLVYGHNVYEFEAGMDARDQYTAVKSSSWDMTDQAIVEEAGADPEITEQGNCLAADMAGVAGPKELLLQHTGRVTNDELRAWAGAQMMRSRLAKIRGKVKIQGFSNISPGDIIELAGFGDRFNGVAFVSSISHRVTSKSIWYTDIEFGLDKDWFANRYSNIMDLPAAGMVPGVHGLQVGVVTNIHEDPDGEDRIRVRLPIIDGKSEGVWARMTTLEAGKERGWVFRPEIDDEVVVGFFNDDPRDPVILGSMFSSAKPSPVAAEEGNNGKGITTRSGMKLLFDDDKVSVTIQTPKGNSIIISEKEGAINVLDENGNKVDLTPDGISLESAADINIKASGDINMEGININLKSQAQFKAEGGAGAELSSSGQTVVKGSIVAIN
ncbi:MAG: type VI secretion system tip protein VgrG [Marinifilaceae bacterium]